MSIVAEVDKTLSLSEFFFFGAYTDAAFFLSSDALTALVASSVFLMASVISVSACLALSAASFSSCSFYFSESSLAFLIFSSASFFFLSTSSVASFFFFSVSSSAFLIFSSALVLSASAAAAAHGYSLTDIDRILSILVFNERFSLFVLTAFCMFRATYWTLSGYCPLTLKLVKLSSVSMLTES